MTGAHVDDSAEARKSYAASTAGNRCADPDVIAARHDMDRPDVKRAGPDQLRARRAAPVARYLAGRGITIAPPPSLRWASRCWHAKARGSLPAMVARVDDIEGRLIGVHRTWLDRDAAGQWHRRDRASLGPIGGCAVRLAEPDKTLLIGEGIETCLSALAAARNSQRLASCSSAMLRALRYSSSAALEYPCCSSDWPLCLFSSASQPALACPLDDPQGIVQHDPLRAQGALPGAVRPVRPRVRATQATNAATPTRAKEEDQPPMRAPEPPVRDKRPIVAAEAPRV
jgi:hypothetical protein